MVRQYRYRKISANSIAIEDTKIPDEDDHIEIGNEDNPICIDNNNNSTLIKSLDCQIKSLVKEFTTNKTTVEKTLQDHSKVLSQLQNRETNREFDRLRKENLELKRQNDEFSERIHNLSYILANLKNKAKLAEDEKASLITAIKLLYKENKRNREQSNVNQADQIDSKVLSTQQHDSMCEQPHPDRPITNRFAHLDVEEHFEEVGFDNAASHKTQMPAKIRQKSKHKASAKSLWAGQKCNNFETRWRCIYLPITKSTTLFIPKYLHR